MKKILMPIAVLLLVGCYSDKEEELYPKPAAAGNGCDTMNMRYTADIQPIISRNCAQAGCHDAITKSFSHDLSSYDGVKTSVNGGRFKGAIMHESGFLAMPKGMAKLPDCDLAKVSAWINAGMPQ